MATKTSKLSQEQLIETVRKKRECNAKAQSVVESLLEQHNKSDEFLAKLKDINQSHYDDIVDERNILRFCGYPLCGRTLTEIPQKKYEISTAANKASEYIKSQILTSPLWLRNQETNLDFKLLET